MFCKSLEGKCQIILRVSLLLVFFLCSVSAFAQKDPAMWWKFEQEKGPTTTERTGKIKDKIKGNFKYVGGVSGEWQSSSEFKNSGLKPETKYRYIAHVRRAGAGDEIIPSTGVYEVTTRRSTNTGTSRFIPEIDKAFANGEEILSKTN